MNNKITAIMNVNENEIRIMRIDNEYFNSAEFGLIILTTKASKIK